MVVLHYTAMETAEAALARLCDPVAEVSAHYVIAEDGRLWRLVDEAERAWHAGVSSWGAVRDVNSHSIGIELANTGVHPFPEPQMAALAWLLAGVIGRWEIRPERVVGHACVAPGRKVDPGARFDWRRLARQGATVWLDAAPDAARAGGGGPPPPPGPRRGRRRRTQSVSRGRAAVRLQPQRLRRLGHRGSRCLAGVCPSVPPL
ncbi:MAG: N-acetylmuramoyl-L-alanine amidase [Pseudomonadota bacterium]